MMSFKEAEARIKAGEKLTLEQVFGPADLDNLPEPEKIIVVVRYQGCIRWHYSDRDYWILDHKKSAQEGRDFGFDVPPFDPSFRGGMEVVDVDNAEAFLSLPDNHLLNFEHWRKTLVEAMPSAQSWWDVGDMFPISNPPLRPSVLRDHHGCRCSCEVHCRKISIRQMHKAQAFFQRLCSIRVLGFACGPP